MHGKVCFLESTLSKGTALDRKKMPNQKFQLYRCTHHLQMEEYWCCLRLMLLSNWNVTQRVLHLVINCLHLNYRNGQEIISGFQFSQPVFLPSSFFTEITGNQESMLDCRGGWVKLLGMLKWCVSPVSCFQTHAFVGSATEYGQVLCPVIAIHVPCFLRFS